LGIIWHQKHTDFGGTGKVESRVAGSRFFPEYAAKSTGLFLMIFGALALLGGLAQINPIWLYGPYDPSRVSNASQPDWYVLFTEGMARIFPPWEISLGNYTIPSAFWGTAAFLPLPFVIAAVYPWVERGFTKDNALHNLLQRPRDVPVRTSLGVMGISFYAVLVLSAGNDLIAYFFDISLNATTWAGRIGVLVVPPIAYHVTYRICIGLQRSDRAVLEHGIETGIIRRLPHGEFIEVHQPLNGVDAHGRPIPLAYQGAPVPKRVNQLGLGGAPVPGSLLTPDPPAQTAALERARAKGTPIRSGDVVTAARVNDGPADGPDA
jgi:ubiquinol-cytochrome c reductase cytochrome b subunit